MSEKNRPKLSFKVWPFSIALWEKDNRRSVSVSKSQKKDGKYEDQTVWLNLSEVRCLSGLLQKMEESVIERV